MGARGQSSFNPFRATPCVWPAPSRSIMRPPLPSSFAKEGYGGQAGHILAAPPAAVDAYCPPACACRTQTGAELVAGSQDTPRSRGEAETACLPQSGMAGTKGGTTAVATFGSCVLRPRLDNAFRPRQVLRLAPPPPRGRASGPLRRARRPCRTKTCGPRKRRVRVPCRAEAVSRWSKATETGRPGAVGSEPCEGQPENRHNSASLRFRERDPYSVFGLTAPSVAVRAAHSGLSIGCLLALLVGPRCGGNGGQRGECC